jgi:hypothetical protein
MHNEEFFIIFIPCKYYSNHKIKEDEMSGACGMLVEKRNACSIFV